MTQNQTKTAISVQNVSKKFGAFEALTDISLEIKESEVVCLIGPSGSGKSTLLRCISFLEQYDEGSVLIEGELLGYTDKGGSRALMSEKELLHARRNIGMVFQQFNLWPHMTVLENVSEALTRVRKFMPSDAKAKAEEVLKKVGMLEKAGSYPSQLSGGQQQRVAIARGLAMEPHLMLFDEPTSALDPELVGEVLEVIKKLAAEGMTLVVVTHEMGFAAHVADKVAFLDKGHLVKYTTTNEFFQENSEKRIVDFLESYKERNIF